MDCHCRQSFCPSCMADYLSLADNPEVRARMWQDAYFREVTRRETAELRVAQLRAQVTTLLREREAK